MNIAYVRFTHTSIGIVGLLEYNYNWIIFRRFAM